MGQVRGSVIKEAKMFADTEEIGRARRDVPLEGIHSMREVLAEFWTTYQGRLVRVPGPLATEGSPDGRRPGCLFETGTVFVQA
jgi:hypothetical protein